MDEFWELVPGDYPYEVSDRGRVRNLRTGHVLTPMMTGSRRPSAQRAKVRVSTNPRVDLEVGALVLTMFHGPRPDGAVVMHRDDDPTNNCISNLCWATPTGNARDMARKGRGGNQRLGPEQVAEIRRRRAAGERGRALALEYGVSEQRICDIVKGRSALA
jgi:hypothetical protein